MRKILLIFAVLLAQCTPKNRKEPINKYFDIIGFTERLIENQANVGTAIKSEVNGLKEETQIAMTDSSFWATELFVLLDMDINKPSLLAAYKVEEGVTDPTSNLLKTIYSILPSANYKVKKIEIKYLENSDEIRQLSGVIESDNSVYVTQQAFHIWVNKKGKNYYIDSLTTKGFNKTIFLDSMVYSSTLKVI